jgi:hypothetical protein
MLSCNTPILKGTLIASVFLRLSLVDSARRF